VFAKIELPPLMGLGDTAQFLLPRVAAATGAKGACLTWRGVRFACREVVGVREEACRIELSGGIGELELYGVALGPEEASALASFCERVLLNAEEYEAVLETAAADPLTGLPNRRAFMERLAEEVARAERSGGRFSVLFLDVDGLKGVNDSLGHPAGDELLKGIAVAVRRCVRRGDVVARYGGDEFVVLLCGAGPDDAAAAARRIVAESARIKIGGFRAGVSIGIASYPSDGVDPGSLVAVADERMYGQKRMKKAE